VAGEADVPEAPPNKDFCVPLVEFPPPNRPPPLGLPASVPPAEAFPKEKLEVPVACPKRLVEPGAVDVVAADGVEEAALDAGAPKLKVGVDILISVDRSQSAGTKGRIINDDGCDLG